MFGLKVAFPSLFRRGIHATLQRSKSSKSGFFHPSLSRSVHKNAGMHLRPFLRSLTLAALIFTSLALRGGDGACAAHKINVRRPPVSVRASE